MTTFSVTLRGRRKTADPAATVARLAALFGRSAADTERALAMPSLTVKRGIDLRTANRYQAALDDSGACATIERESMPESSLDGIPDGYRSVPAMLRQAEQAYASSEQIHAYMVSILANGDHGPGMRASMLQTLQGMCSGRIGIDALLRYFSADRLHAIVADGKRIIAAQRHGAAARSVHYGYRQPGAGHRGDADAAFSAEASPYFEAFLLILREHGVLTPGAELPAGLVLRDGKASQIRAPGQRVQYCHQDSPYVHAGTLEACHAAGVAVSRPLRDGLHLTSMIPYANLLLDGGDSCRPLPYEAVLERQQLSGYALPQAPELRLKGSLEVELDLRAPLETAPQKAVFFNFAARVSQLSEGRLEAASLAPGRYRMGTDLALAAQVLAQLLEPLRLR